MIFTSQMPQPSQCPQYRYAVIATPFPLPWAVILYQEYLNQGTILPKHLWCLQQGYPIIAPLPHLWSYLKNTSTKALPCANIFLSVFSRDNLSLPPPPSSGLWSYPKNASTKALPCANIFLSVFSRDNLSSSPPAQGCGLTSRIPQLRHCPVQTSSSVSSVGTTCHCPPPSSGLWSYPKNASTKALPCANIFLSVFSRDSLSLLWVCSALLVSFTWRRKSHKILTY